MVLENFFGRPAELALFHLPPLAPEMDGFCDWLHHQGFSQRGMRPRLWQAVHFNKYLLRLGVNDIRDVETSLAERFINDHLRRCRCGDRYGGKHVRTPKSVRSFMDYLSERGLIAPPSQPSTPYQELLQEYLDYLKCERNLAEKTVKAHQTYLIPFLEDLGAAPANRLRELSSEQVLASFTNYAQDKGQNTLQRLQVSLRVFLRFCLQQGYMERDLSQAVPGIRTYKLADVPRGVSEEGAQKVLECIDRTTTVGLRDFAIIQLFHTYGVRGGHVRALRLHDVQWRENLIRFQAHKGGKELIEPLFDGVGESLLEYLRHGRPQAPYSEVFLTIHRPFRPLRSSSTVSNMVERRMRKAGVRRPKACSHVFRHGFASRMLQHGQSLKTIADLLGHRNINTTFIYTKVDLETLKQVPLEWPEVSS